MDTTYIYGNSQKYQSTIKQSEIDREVSEILEILKKERQTYYVNKLVLNNALEALKHIPMF